MVFFATSQFIYSPAANAVTANTGAGGTFTYSAGATNAQIALAACEAVNGVGNCRTGSCGSLSYYYKSTDLACDCRKAVGTYEFIYNNTGYTNVGQDYAMSNTVSVSGNSMFVRKKNVAQCYVADVWLLVNSNLGAALNVTSSITISTSAGNANFRAVKTISANGSVAGKITFFPTTRKFLAASKFQRTVLMSQHATGNQHGMEITL